MFENVWNGGHFVSAILQRDPHERQSISQTVQIDSENRSIYHLSWVIQKYATVALYLGCYM